MRRCRDSDDKAYEGGEQGAKDEGEAGLRPVGEVGGRHGADGCGTVDWNSEELGCCGCIAQLVDDGWQEERDSEEWDPDANVHDCGDVDLPVLEGGFDVLPSQLLGRRRAGLRADGALVAQFVDDEDTLSGGEKGSGARVVVDDEEGDHGNEDCHDTLENEDPAPAVEATYSIHFGDGKC